MQLVLIDDEGIVIDRWDMDDELSRVLFEEVAQEMGEQSITTKRIRAKLKEYEDD